jgi:hypothetical protein
MKGPTEWKGGVHSYIHIYTVVSSSIPSAISLNLFTLMMKAIRYTETSVFTRATKRYIPEDVILRSYRREILKSYIALTGLSLHGRRYIFPVR